MGTVLAFDFGTKRIGVATGETLIGQAHPLAVIPAAGGRWREGIDRLVAEWQPEHLVVGLPLLLDGASSSMTSRCRRFALALERRFLLPVDLADERLSSVDAEWHLRETGRNARAARPLVDAVAAQLILQTWFAQNHHVPFPAFA